MRKTLLYISIVLNLVLILGFCLHLNHTKQENIKYFDFSRHIGQPKEIRESDSALYKVTCFYGNSITANWINLNSSFFHNNNFVNKGTGGQTSTQLLLRFQEDICSLHPDILVLNTGINDIGEGDGFYRESFTLQNIQSMVDICKQRDIKLILSSVLPATKVNKNRFLEIKNLQDKIESLNQQLISLANRNSLLYVDYNSKLKNTDGTFNKLYTFDGIHPNVKGYEIMETLILAHINN